MPLKKENLVHFLTLAKKGKYTGASGGEVRANRLADAIVQFIPGLDQDAVEGAIMFLLDTYKAPGTCRDLVENF